MADFLSLSFQCYTIDFSQVNFGDTFPILQEGLLACKSLAEIKITNSDLGNEGALVIARVLLVNKRSVIRNLTLHNATTDENGKYKYIDKANWIGLQAILTHFNGLSLSFQCPSFSDSYASLFSLFLVEKQNKLTTLSLSHVSLDSAIETLFKGLLESPCTSSDAKLSLDLSYCSLGKSAGAILGELLKSNSHICSLTLSHNSLGDLGATGLADGLKVNKIETK